MLTLARMKDELRIKTTSQDNLLREHIGSALAHVENDTRFVMREKIIEVVGLPKYQNAPVVFDVPWRGFKVKDVNSARYWSSSEEEALASPPDTDLGLLDLGGFAAGNRYVSAPAPAGGWPEGSPVKLELTIEPDHQEDELTQAAVLLVRVFYDAPSQISDRAAYKVILSHYQEV